MSADQKFSWRRVVPTRAGAKVLNAIRDLETAMDLTSNPQAQVRIQNALRELTSGTE